MSKRLWDAIIVGAGPAGASAAIHLRKAGLSVLMLDRRRFPRPKPCGGLLSERALRYAPVSLAPCLRNTPSLVQTADAAGRTRLVRETVALVRRTEMDSLLFRTAIEAGAHFLHVRGIRKLKTGQPARLVLDDRRWLDARFIIGADGSNSMVRRLLGQRASCGAFAIETETPSPEGLSRQQVLFDFGATEQGYGWIFPIDGFANVGLARFDGAVPTRDELGAFLASHGFASDRPFNVKGAPINTFGQGINLGRHGVLLIGDAAGLADDLTGEGICHAFQSAALAAQAIIENQLRAFDTYQTAITNSQIPLLAKRYSQAGSVYGQQSATFLHYGVQ